MLRLIISLALAVAVEGFALPPRVRRSTWLLAGADASSDTNELVLAARHGDVAAASKALAADPSLLNARVNCAKPPQMDQSTALIWASRLGFAAVVDVLLAAGGADVDAATTAGWTALFAAAQNGEEECVESLLVAGADLATALALGDEFTNVKLARMAGPARMQLAQAQPTPSPPPPAASSSSFMESESALWRATAARAPASAASDLPAGLSELEEVRLKLKWSAPPTDAEEAAALAARCTVYKLRYSRLQELEGGAPPAPRAAAAPADARASPPAAASLQGSGGDRLAVLEAKIDQLLADSKANYAAGFKDGFAAAQGVKTSPSQIKGSEFGGSLF